MAGAPVPMTYYLRQNDLMVHCGNLALGKYLNLKATEAEVDSKFYRYVPEPDKVMVPHLREKSIQQANAERLERVRKRQRDVAIIGEVNAINVKRRRLRLRGPADRG